MTVPATRPLGPLRRLRVFVVRHGETHENVKGIIQGQMDTPLSPFGRLQAATTADYLSNIRFDRIITSPLQRARDTAQAILSKQPTETNLQLEQDDRIKERAFGILEGKPYWGGKKKDEGTEGIEKTPDLHERLTGFWNELITVQVPADSQNHRSPSRQTQTPTELEGEEQTIALVSHGASISALLNGVLLEGQYIHIPEHIEVIRYNNCSITELVIPTILDHRTPSASRGLPGAPHLMDEWLVKPNHVQKKQLKESSDTVDKDDQVVLQDLGYGKGVGCAVGWAETKHLHGLVKPEETLSGEQAASTPKVNVDELVGNGK